MSRQHRGRGTRLACALAALLWVCAGGACGKSHASRVLLTFEDPLAGRRYTTADDLDQEQPGVQIRLRVVSQGLDEDSRVGLLQNDVLTGEQRVAEEMVFEVTLRRGINRFQLTLDGEALQEITVTLRDPCGLVSFALPSVPEGGEALEFGGDAFCERRRVKVVAVTPDVGDGRNVTLVVNGEVKAEAAVGAGHVSFEGVELSEGENALAVRMAGDASGGEACPLIYFPADIQVDCGVPDCRIVTPAQDTQKTLSSADDLSPTEAGLQVDVEVLSDASASGQTVTLFVNGNRDLARRATAGLLGDSVRARFSSVDLGNGSQAVTVECKDAFGNVAVDRATWNVDVQPCDLAIRQVSPEPAAGGVIAVDAVSAEVTLTVDVRGDDCTELRGMVAADAECTGIDSAPKTALGVGDTGLLETSLTVTAAGTAHLCVQVSDAAGNVQRVSRAVRFISQGPALSIRLPDGGPQLKVNAAGDSARGFVPDGDPRTTSCDADLDITCRDAAGAPLDGVEVTLLRADTNEVLGRAPCESGMAVFRVAEGSPVSLPSVPGSRGYLVVARAEHQGLLGTSLPISVVADCQPPTVRWDKSFGVCEAELPDDDENPLPGYQVHVRAFVETAVHEANVVVSQQGVPLAEPVTSSLRSQDTPNRIDFEELTLSEGGNLVLTVCGRDEVGNETCDSDCQLSLGLPRLRVDRPASGAGLFSPLAGVDYRDADGDGQGDSPDAGGCTGSGAFNILVEASTDADPGALATLQLGALEPVQVPIEARCGSDAVTYPHCIKGCLPADGADSSEVFLTVQVPPKVDSEVPVAAVRRVPLRIDALAPVQVEGLQVELESCRDPSILSFSHEAADDFTFAAFEVRCARAPIEDAASWLAAERVFDGLPTTRISVAHVPPGEVRYCSVRAYDQAGAYSPLSESVEVALEDFWQRSIALPPIRTPSGEDEAAAAGVPMQVLPAGDVDADGRDDFLVVVTGESAAGHAYLYFGQSMHPSEPMAEPIEFFRADGDLGVSAASLGNFDGDIEATADFAIGAPFGGAVYVVLGRKYRHDHVPPQVGPPVEPGWVWPAPGSRITVTNHGCGTDVCFFSAEPTFGHGVAGLGDFDGDARGDLGVSVLEGPPRVLLGAVDYRPVELGIEAGLCVDADEGGGAVAPCVGGAVPARGFVVDEGPEALVGVVGSSGQGDLLFAETGDRGELGARLWVLPGRAHSGDGVLSLTGQASLLDTLSHVGNISPVGFLNERASDPNASVDVAVSAGAAEPQLHVYFGEGAGADYRLSAGSRFSITDSQADRGFARTFHGAEVPGRPELADLTGNGTAAMVVGSGSPVPAGAPQGEVDVIHGRTTVSGPGSAPREQVRARVFTEVELAGPAGRTAYPRHASMLGDVDGDGRNDFAILEDDPGAVASTDGRILVLGWCQ